jgi:hypothetical protein
VGCPGISSIAQRGGPFGLMFYLCCPGGLPPPQTTSPYSGGFPPPRPPGLGSCRPQTPARGWGGVKINKTHILYVTQYFRAANLFSGQHFGRRSTGKTQESALRPAFSRPEGRFRCFPGSSPAKIRPGRPINGPEALVLNIEYIYMYRCYFVLFYIYINICCCLCFYCCVFLFLFSAAG